MDRIGIRELRQHASRYLERVEDGEVIEITNRGRVVARLVPARRLTGLAKLEAEGRITPARGKLSDLGPPLPPKPGVPLPSQILQQMRDEARF